MPLFFVLLLFFLLKLRVGRAPGSAQKSLRGWFPPTVFAYFAARHVFAVSFLLPGFDFCSQLPRRLWPVFCLPLFFLQSLRVFRQRLSRLFLFSFIWSEPLAETMIECVLLLQNVFSYYRMCSLSIECVRNPAPYCNMQHRVQQHECTYLNAALCTERLLHSTLSV